MRPKPLDGVRVLDLTRLLPGPLCTQHLADLGADVIKIEDLGAGDYARALGHVRVENSDLFLLVNRNKRALRVDLKHAQGRDVFRRLARDADVVVEGFRPGVMDRLGVGYEALHEQNPRLVYCAITGYGQDGPNRERAGHDLNYLAETGVLDQTGAAGGPPAICNLQVADLLGGTLCAAMGILAALVDARASGRGRFVDVAMADAVLAHAIFPMVALQSEGAVRPRGEDFVSGGLPCYAVYATADGRHLAVAALERKFWDALCEALGRPDLKPRHMASGDGARALREELAGIFGAHPLAHWQAVFRDADCCVSPVLRLDEAIAGEQARSRGMVVENDHPADGPVTQFALPLKFSEFEFAVERPAPMPGEHTGEILRAAGYADDAIARLREDGAVG